MLPLIAEAAVETVGPWAGVVATILSTGFAGWVAWHLLTVALPKMHENFVKALAEQQKSDAESAKESRADGKESLAAVLTHCEKESTRRDDSFRVEMGLVCAAMKDTRETLEEVRDALRDMTAARRRQRPPLPPARLPPGPGGIAP